VKAALSRQGRYQQAAGNLRSRKSESLALLTDS